MSLTQPRRFGVTVNSRINAELRSRPNDPIGQQLAGFLDRLDGEQRFAVQLWELPEGKEFDQVDLRSWPRHYLQAGGSRQRMAVEVRLPQGDEGSQYAVAHASLTDGEPVEELTISGHTHLVYKSELFSAVQALAVFVSYWHTGAVPSDYHLRRLPV